MFPTRFFLFAIALPLGILAIVLSPELLIKLGPLRGSLLHANELVRDTALLEVKLGKFALIISSLALVLAALFRDNLTSSKIVLFFAEHSKIYTNHIHSKFFSKIAVYTLGISWILCFLFMVVIAAMLPRDLMFFIAEEDGLMEYASAILYFIAGLLAVYSAVKLPRTTVQKIILCFFGLGLIFIAGEEISWGQRIFNIETLDVFEEINVQGENNLHNSFGYLADHIFILGTFLLGVVIPLLNHYYSSIRGFLNYFGIPIASTGLAIGFGLISILQHWGVTGLFDMPSGLRVAEIREFLAAIAFLFLVIEHYLRFKNN